MNGESGTGVYVYQQIVKTTAEWEADKTVPVENVWLFERREDGKIVTKLSDGQHCYSDLPAYGLSAWQAAQMGGYKGTEEEFYESLGTFDEKIKKVESLVASMSGNATRELISKLGMKSLSKGVKVDVLEGVVTVSLSLNLKYGYSIKESTTKVQEKVKAAIENMTGLEVADVNIRVAGVEVPEED